MVAARTDAAALSYLDWRNVFLVLLLLCMFLHIHLAEALKYSCAELLELNTGDTCRLTADLFFISPEIVRTPFGTLAAARQRRKHCERRQRRGKQAGVLTRLKANPFKPPLPTIFLSNARSIHNKMDEIRLRLTTQRNIANCCSMIFTETWLDYTTPDKAIELAGLTSHRADSTADSGKKIGGGLCIYINNSWCTNTTVVERLCCPDVEFMLRKCRPFYLPREFSVVYICTVYIPPDANAKLALA